MRLIRYLRPDGLAPGMLDNGGGVRDLSYVVMDIGPEHLSPDDLDILRSVEPRTLPPGKALGLAPPLSGVGRVFADFDGPTPNLMPANADAPRGARFRAGVAAAVGAAEYGRQAWSGAWMAAMAAPEAGWLALGPWLWAPDRLPRLDRLDGAVTVDGDIQPFRLKRDALDAALANAAGAAPGDLVLATALIAGAPAVEVRVAIDRLGEQRHPVHGSGYGGGRETGT